MSGYLLDTNVVIAVLNDIGSRPARMLEQCRPEDVCISSIVAHELFYGAFKGQRRAHNVAIVDALRFNVAELDEEDAREAGEIRADLASRGTSIGPYDVLIAGQARARRLTLVTHNVAEFERVTDLAIVDWA